MREPMAAPKTTKYSAVVMTGVNRLVHKVRPKRASSKRQEAKTPRRLKAGMWMVYRKNKRYIHLKLKVTNSYSHPSFNRNGAQTSHL